MMDAIVTAGGIPKPEEPLYPQTMGKSKSLLDVAGKPMIQWVLDALRGSARIGRVVVVGLDETSGVTCENKPLDFLPTRGDMLANIEAGARWLIAQNPLAPHIFVASSDIPAITSAMVDWVLDAANDADCDFYYSVVDRTVMEQRFPGSRRSYVRLKDAEVCGADLNVIGARAIVGGSENSLWQKVVEARKSAFKQAQLVGFDMLWLLLTRGATLEYAEREVSKRLGIKGRVLRCPYAEVGMDVDKPFQLEILTKDLETHR
ncbi:MAG: nucleotidyltransferase family protein [Chloroflexi bacterium]|nr:nucleotidyltransferase family protein [Chloroflexota bacterium]